MPDATDHLSEAREALKWAENRCSTDIESGDDVSWYAAHSLNALAHGVVAAVEKLAVIAESARSIGVGLALRSAVDQHAALGPCGCETPVVEDGVALCRRCWRNVIPNVKEQDDGA